MKKIRYIYILVSVFIVNFIYAEEPAIRYAPNGVGGGIGDADQVTAPIDTYSLILFLVAICIIAYFSFFNKKTSLV